MNGEFQGYDGSDFVARPGSLLDRMQQAQAQRESENSSQINENSETIKNNEKENRYPYGRAVRVPRNSGAIDEEGWVCCGICDNGMIRLSNDRTQELKLLSAEELDKYNLPENINKPEIKIGSIVKVKRSSGEIDDNWIVVDVNKDEDLKFSVVTVSKQNEQNQTMTKRVTLSELENINRELADQSEIIKPEIKLRTVVKVQRSNGEIEDNWTVVGLEQENESGDTVAIVSKQNEQNQTMVKRVLLSELEDIN